MTLHELQPDNKYFTTRDALFNYLMVDQQTFVNKITGYEKDKDTGDMYMIYDNHYIIKATCDPNIKNEDIVA